MPPGQEPISKSLELLEKLEEHAPRDNVRLVSAIAALRQALLGEARQREDAEKLLTEYEEAYNKLTAPANRLGVFLQWLEKEEGQALISVGDQEFVSLVDPNYDAEKLETGSRIKVNEAYAVVGALPLAQNGPIVKVSEVLDDRLRIGGEAPGSEGRIVSRASFLKEAAIQTGDEVRMDATGKVAVEHFPKQETRDYFLEDVPEIPWEKVGGQDDAIKLIRETIEQPLLHGELLAKYEKKPVKGILLYGPPGCGKTLIGKATAHNLTKEYSAQVGKPVKEYFMAISGPKILNMWLGETERMVREIFKTAREKAKEGRLVFIFMDEAESVLRTRSSGRWLNISNTVVPQFCAELDGLVALDNVVLMLTSNRPDYIDPAVLRPERIDRKVKINRPDRAASEQILGIYLHANIPIDSEVLKRNHGEVDCARKELIEAAVDHLWRKNKGTEFLKVYLKNGSTETLYYRDMVSGALLKSVVDRAKDFAIKRAIAAPEKDHGIMLEDLIQSIDREYGENEIFPKNDTMEDWLQLLDQAPENVASVKPVRSSESTPIRKNVV